MTETIRYSLIGRSDISFGKANLTVTLADGRVITMSQVDVGAILDDSSLSTKTLSSMTFSGTTTFSSLTASTMCYIDANKALVSTAAPTNGQILIGSTGSVPVLGTITGLGAVTVTNSAGGISIDAGGEFIGSLELAAAVGSNALTVSLKTSTGTDPSSTAPVNIRFRDTTLTSGGYTNVAVTGALSVTASAGSTFGFTSSLASRLYILAINNAGTAELAFYHAYNPTGPTLKGLNESGLISTTAEGGAGGADSAQTVYSTSARSNVTFRILGYLEITTGATAGNWSNAPTVIQVMGPGVPRTNSIIQTQYTALTAATFSTTSTTMVDITNFTVSITPTSAANIIKVAVAVYTGGSASDYVSFLVVRGSTGILLGDTASNRVRVSGTLQHVGANGMHCAKIVGFDAPAAASSTTYKMQMMTSANTAYINRGVTDTDTAAFTRAASTIVVEEIFV